MKFGFNDKDFENEIRLEPGIAKYRVTGAFEDVGFNGSPRFVIKILCVQKSGQGTLTVRISQNNRFNLINLAKSSGSDALYKKTQDDEEILPSDVIGLEGECNLIRKDGYINIKTFVFNKTENNTPVQPSVSEMSSYESHMTQQQYGAQQQEDFNDDIPF